MSRVIPALPATLPNPLRFTSTQLARSTDWVDLAETVNLGISTGHVQPVISQEFSHIHSLYGTGVWKYECAWRIPILSDLHDKLKVGIKATVTGTPDVRFRTVYGGSTLVLSPTSGWVGSDGGVFPHLNVAADPTGEFEEVILETYIGAAETVYVRNLYATYLDVNVGGTYPLADTLPNTVFNGVVAMDTAHLAADKPLDAAMGQELVLGTLSHLRGRVRSYTCVSATEGHTYSTLGAYPHRAVIPRMDLISELIVWVRYTSNPTGDSAIYIQHGEGDETTLDNFGERTGYGNGEIPAGGSVTVIPVPSGSSATWTRVVVRLQRNRGFGVPVDAPTVGFVSIRGGSYNDENAGTTTLTAMVLGFTVMGV